MLCLPRRIISVALGAAVCFYGPAAANAASGDPHIETIRYWSFGDVTRVAIETQGEFKLTFDHLDSPPRLFFDLRGLKPATTKTRGTQLFHVGDRLIRQIRVAETEPGVSRVVFDLEIPAEFTSSQLTNPDRLMIEVRPKSGTPAESLTSRSTLGVRRAHEEPAGAIATPSYPLPAIVPVNLFAKTSLALPDSPEDSLPKSTLVWNGAGRSAPQGRAPAKQTIETRSVPKRERESEAAPERIEAAKTSESNRSLVRVFGLKIHKVVIDAGHGGHDTGTIGARGLMEKDLVLDVALRLGKIVQQRLGAELVYTRSKDVFIPLEERTHIANGEKADLFISIHANSSPAAGATGVETYYFNFTSDQHSIDLATRENASSNSTIFELNDLLHKAVLNAKVEESREFAQKVQSSLYAMSVRMNGTSRDRGVKKAPFVVLIGATMPSILAEIAFVSNPRDERLLRRDEQRQKIAESLYKGVAAYANSLSHVQLARAKQTED